MKQHYDETFLIRWLNNELSDKERIAFEKSNDFTDYTRILESSERFLLPNFDKKKVLEKIQQKTISKPKVKKLIPNWVYAVAASIAILLGSYYFLNTSTTHSSEFGEQLAVVLPDGSEVILNAKSKISYHKKNWKDTRTLFLNGEAFFKVNKGSTFTVKSDVGIVKVLGTQFNVKTDSDYFEVLCYEGKVSAVSNKEKAILTLGKAFRNHRGNIEKFTFKESVPSWTQGESTFNSVPLSQVIKALEKQYKIKIEYKNLNTDQRFTGSFNHKSLKLALKTVFIPMEINYTFKNENTVILVKG